MESAGHKVSILIPLYNAEKYIQETMRSVLGQTFRDFEVIIVDDDSTDRSLEIVQSYQDERIRVFCNDKNRGISYTRNKGLGYCSGEYVALLDDDDIALHSRLEKQVAFLDANPDIDAVGGNAQWIDGTGQIVRGTIEVVTEPQVVKMFLLFRNIFNNSEMTFRRAVAEDNGIRYSDGCYGLEDFLFWIQFASIGKIGNINDLVLKKRVGGDNETAHMRSRKREERKNKYLGLQKYSLALNGFKLEQMDEQVLKEFFAEEPRICRDGDELGELAGFLKRIALQAREMEKDYCRPMERWFQDLLNWNMENMRLDYLAQWRHSMGTKDVTAETDPWFSEDLFTLVSMNRLFAEKERYIQKLITAKDWLEHHSEEQERHIQELVEGKEWLQQHSEDQEAYIQELLEGKKWLEQQCNDQKAYIQKLLRAKARLEQNNDKKATSRTGLKA